MKANVLEALKSGNRALAEKLDAEQEQGQGQVVSVQTQKQTQGSKQEPSVEEPQPKPQQQEPKPKPKPKKPKKQPGMNSYIKPKYYDLAKAYVEANEPVLLSGEAGTGKNELCKALAEDLGLDFYFSNAVSDIYQLVGYGNAEGKFIKTQFYDFCINGGLFMFDEIDASDPQALIEFNSAIANRYFDFPVVGRVQLNENCRFIACANTKGQGASLRYVGRNQLDGATLDRYALIQTDYDTKVEMKIAKDNSELVAFIDSFRNAVNRTATDLIVSYRALKRIVQLEEKVGLDKILKTALLKGLEKDEIRCIANEMSVSEDKYTIALRKLGGLKW